MIIRPAAFFCPKNLDTRPTQKPDAVVNRLSARHTEHGMCQH
ncbi:hypothetical protein ApDm4_1859 [Acetobacter pomorum]|nr:hypothetical protein ApDm4_1859 [Acetobacter pomorum]